MPMVPVSFAETTRNNVFFCVGGKYFLSFKPTHLTQLGTNLNKAFLCLITHVYMYSHGMN